MRFCSICTGLTPQFKVVKLREYFTATTPCGKVLGDGTIHWIVVVPGEDKHESNRVSSAYAQPC